MMAQFGFVREQKKKTDLSLRFARGLRNLLFSKEKNLRKTFN